MKWSRSALSTPWRARARAIVGADQQPPEPLVAASVSDRGAGRRGRAAREEATGPHGDLTLPRADQPGLARDSDDRELRPATTMQIEDFAILPKQALTHIGNRCVAPEEDVALAEALALPPDP